ncbi:MAG: T9SS type A sorting domain-containing protein, partial [Flavobacteriales bacterium]|nr:T9SS type A sorting domain-containing protein [Flavobacteriales bacterium]
DNLNCSWLIQPLGATIINLSFTQFDTETGFDFVTIYDGANNNAPVLGTYSGSTLPLALNSSGGSIFVEFNSDQAVNETGWEINYNSSSNQCFTNLQLTSLNGNINDGSNSNNYQNNLNCSWVIQPVLATTITAQFNNFDVDNLGDTLFIYDGPTSGSPLLASYTGTSLPATVSSTGGDMFIEFVTNGISTAAGWDLSYNSTTAASCAGQTNLTAAIGSFSDGSGTANYDNNLNCSWLIQPAGNAALITLNMTSVNLTGFNDMVRVYDGANNGGILLGTIRFNNTGNALVAYSGSMFLEFTTSATNTAQGWSATYVSSTTLCQPNTVLTANTGGFTDGSVNGASYLNNTDCEWLIQPTASNVAVRLTFGRFNTAINDSLIIYDGTTTSAPVLATYTANSVVNPVTSSGGSILLKFKTNSTATANGWFVNYNTQTRPYCGGLTNLTSPTGSFDDGSGTADYVQNSTCSWLINPPGVISIDLDFTYFVTQSNFDFLRAYDGVDNTAPLLASFSGSTTPPTTTAISGNMFVEFITSNQNNTAGWNATYTSTSVVIIDAAPDTVYINAGAGSTASFALTANSSWSTSDNQSWLIPTPVNGLGNSTINILALQGNIGPERSALLFIDATTSSARDTVVVIQSASGRFISSSPDTLFFGSTAAASQVANFNTNVSWNLSATENWINFTPTSGINNGTAVVSASDNTVNQTRQGYLVITGNLSATNDTIVIIQDSLAYAISVNPQQLTLNSTAGSNDSVQLNANLSWIASASETWLSLSPSSGSDTSILKITANSDAPSTQIRSAYILIAGGNGRFSDTVYVDQLGITPVLEGNPDTLILANNNGSNGVINITSTGTWTASTNSSLFSISQSNGVGNSTTNITSLTTNNTGFDITSSLILNDPIDNVSDTVIIIQEGIIPILEGNPDTLILAKDSGSNGAINITSTGAWTATINPSLFATSQSNGTGNSTITITSNTTNNTSSSTFNTLILNNPIHNINDTVIIVQEGITDTINVSPDSVTLSSGSGSSATFTINSTTNWSINTLANWFSVNPNTGTGNGVITITAVSENQSGSERTATLSVDGIGALSKTVVVTQIDTSAPHLEISADTIYIAKAQASTGTFSILSNTNNWTLSENSNWLAITPTSGSGNQTITALAISANLISSPRYAEITASSAGLPDKIVIIAQAGVVAVAQFSPDSLVIGADSSSFGTITINSNLSFWSISENSNWLILDKTFSGFSNQVIATAIEKNLTGLPRFTIVTLTAPPLTPQEIKVIQDTNLFIGLNESLFKQSITLYPNPTSGNVVLKIGDQFIGSEIQANLYTVIGTKVPINLELSSNSKNNIDLNHLPNGIYFLMIRYRQEMHSIKISLNK